jgi:hypothetical protein
MKVNYSFTALTPLFTGSDENFGTTRTLRREKVLLAKPVYVDSSFENDTERRKAIMDVIYHVYSNIPSRLKAGNYGFYDAYASKLKAAAGCQTKFQFINKILADCSITTLADGSAQIVKNALDCFSDTEFLETLKEEHSYLMIMLREYVKIFANQEFGMLAANLDKLFQTPNKPASFTKSFELVPYFGGNSIRGYLRRLAMSDFCKLADIEKIDKVIYHQLFTGGVISENSEKYDIAAIERYVAMCPPIGLLGSAIGSCTIEGELKVIGARLRCRENHSGNLSMHELTEILFGTRKDDTRTGTEIEVEDDRSEKEKENANPVQMLYQNEAFVTGSVFDSSFVLTTDDSLLISAFWRMLKLWTENNVIGGNSARDYGIIDLNFDIPIDADREYLAYISANRDEIQKYFSAPPASKKKKA